MHYRNSEEFDLGEFIIHLTKHTSVAMPLFMECFRGTKVVTHDKVEEFRKFFKQKRVAPKALWVNQVKFDQDYKCWFLVVQMRKRTCKYCVLTVTATKRKKKQAILKNS